MAGISDSNMADHAYFHSDWWSAGLDFVHFEPRAMLWEVQGQEKNLVLICLHQENDVLLFINGS